MIISHPLWRRVAAFMLAFLAAPAAHASDALVLGSYAYPTLDRQQAMAPLAKLVETASGRSVTIRLYKNPDEIAAAVAAGEVDMAVLNLGAWLRVAREPEVVPLAMLVPAPEVQEQYRAVLLARSRPEVTNLAQVREAASDMRLVAVLPGSTSGGLVQLAALSDGEAAPVRWRAVSYAGSHEAALAALLGGAAEMAAIAEAPWRAWLTANPQTADRPHVVWRSAPLPTGPVVCRPSARIDCVRLARVLVSEAAPAMAAARQLAQGWPELAGAERFVSYDPARYDALIAAGSQPAENPRR